jgi:hypothetical protein
MSSRRFEESVAAHLRPQLKNPEAIMKNVYQTGETVVSSAAKTGCHRGEVASHGAVTSTPMRGSKSE